MDTLRDILCRELADYVGDGTGANIRLLYSGDDSTGVYAINTVPYPERIRPANVMILARIENETIIIEEDRTDKPLFEALLAAGVPREKIVLAYQGEPSLANK